MKKYSVIYADPPWRYKVYSKKGLGRSAESHLLASREIENIFENSDFVYLLNQASGDRQILSKALNISPSQQNYITNSNAGEGLIFYGSTIVPFKDDFPKDTMLYRYMTTKPEETLQN